MTMPLPHKVLIANRGEIAVRVARTCRDLGVATVAVHSDVDEDALHVRSCDEAVRLGGATPAESYLRIDALVDAATRSGADAVHPGYGFLAENAAFARAVVAAGLTWIGPTAEVVAAMGDKLEAKRRMAAAGVPLVPGAELPGGSEAHDAAANLDAAGQQVGFPLMVKAAAGGGGKGMRIVHDAADLADAVAAARREAASAFGDDTVFLERYVARPRHIEVQVLGDVHGQVVHLFERECSIQRRHQKVVEETPSPGIDDEVRTAICEAAVTAARAIGYVNAGTVEFIVDEAALARRRGGEDLDPRATFAFLEVNTRLQVEHPVTEEVVRVLDRATGRRQALDLVRLQLLLAGGLELPFSQDDLVQVGHAIEVRLYAEDPANGYLPVTGTLDAFVAVDGPGIRWDAGVREGDVVSPHYDPMLAKVVAHGPTRGEAASRLARALDHSVVLGVRTNQDLLVEVLRDAIFLAGDTTTAYLDERPRPASTPGTSALRFALVAAAVDHLVAGSVDHLVAGSVEQQLPRVRPGFSNAATFEHRVRYDVGGAGTWQVTCDARRDSAVTCTLVEVDGRATPADQDAADGPAVAEPEVVRAHVLPVGDGRVAVDIDGHRCHVQLVTRGRACTVVTSDGRVELHRHARFPEQVAEVAAGATLAPMPGSVTEVAVAVGQQVERGALLCIVEAMKMEHRITAPVAGTVADVAVAPGQQVDADDVLVVVEPDDTDPGA